MTHRGFTLIELLVVMCIIATLMALSLPVVGVLRQRSNNAVTAALVQSIAGAIATYQQRSITCADGRDRAIWDIDGDGIIDGDPAHPDAPPLLSNRAPAGYRGMLTNLGIEVATGSRDAQGRPIDRWRNPLRIAYARGAYGGAGFGVWSMGPNAVTHAPDKPTPTPAELIDDDLRSWRWKKDR